MASLFKAALCISAPWLALGGAVQKASAVKYKDSACTERWKSETVVILNVCDLYQHNDKMVSKKSRVDNKQVVSEVFDSTDCSGTKIASAGSVEKGTVGGTTCIQMYSGSNTYITSWTVTDITDADYAWREVFTDSSCTQKVNGLVDVTTALNKAGHCEAVPAGPVPPPIPATTKSFTRACHAGNIVYATFESTDCSGASGITDTKDMAGGETKGECKKMQQGTLIWYVTNTQCSPAGLAPGNANSATRLSLAWPVALLVLSIRFKA